MDYSIEEIIDKYIQSVFSFVYRMTGMDKNLAEDITQDVFIKVWKKMNKLDKEKNIKSYIFSIAYSTTIDYLRKNKPSSFMDEFDAEFDQNEIIDQNEKNPEEIYIFNEKDKEDKEKIEKALEKVDPITKTIILMHIVEDITFIEISQILKISINTVKSRYRRGVNKIRETNKIN